MDISYSKGTAFVKIKLNSDSDLFSLEKLEEYIKKKKFKNESFGIEIILNYIKNINDLDRFYKSENFLKIKNFLLNEKYKTIVVYVLDKEGKLIDALLDKNYIYEDNVMSNGIILINSIILNKAMNIQINDKRLFDQLKNDFLFLSKLSKKYNKEIGLSWGAYDKLNTNELKKYAIGVIGNEILCPYYNNLEKVFKVFELFFSSDKVLLLPNIPDYFFDKFKSGIMKMVDELNNNFSLFSLKLKNEKLKMMLEMNFINENGKLSTIYQHDKVFSKGEKLLIQYVENVNNNNVNNNELKLHYQICQNILNEIKVPLEYVYKYKNIKNINNNWEIFNNFIINENFSTLSVLPIDNIYSNKFGLKISFTNSSNFGSNVLEKILEPYIDDGRMMDLEYIFYSKDKIDKIYNLRRDEILSNLKNILMNFPKNINYLNLNCKLSDVLLHLLVFKKKGNKFLVSDSFLRYGDNKIIKNFCLDCLYLFFKIFKGISGFNVC